MLKELAIVVQAGIPAIFEGMPGIGKTHTVYQLGRLLDLPVEVVILSIRDPTDLLGMPYRTNSGVAMDPPDWAIRLAEAGKGIVFFDELSTAPFRMQVAALRIIQEGYVGSLKLPEKVARVAAANPPEVAGASFRLTPPMANRLVHIDVQTPTVMTWTRRFVEGFPDEQAEIPILPENWREKLPEAKGLVASFLTARPELLFRYPESEEERSKAWPSPRTWDMAATLIAACRAANLNGDLLASLLTGAVGLGAATEFLTWLDNLDLPDPEEVLQSPETFKFPERDDHVYAILFSVASCALNKGNRYWHPAWQVITRAVEQGKADLAAVVARTLVLKKPKGVEIPADIKALAPIIQEAGLLPKEA